MHIIVCRIPTKRVEMRDCHDLRSRNDKAPDKSGNYISIDSLGRVNSATTSAKQALPLQ